MALTTKEKEKFLKQYLDGETLRDIANEENIDYSQVYFALSQMEGYVQRRYEGKYIETVKANKKKILQMARTMIKADIARSFDIPISAFCRIADSLGIIKKQRKGSIVDASYNEIKKMRESGVSYNVIAQRFRVSTSCIASFCLRHGIEMIQSKTIKSSFAREKNEMGRDHANGMSIAEISKKYGCSKSIVSLILRDMIGKPKTKGMRETDLDR